MKKIDSDTLLTLYESAFYVRTVEQIIADNYSKGLIRCPTHLSIGQEMVPALVSHFNNNNDLAVSTHRAHGHYLAKGGSLPLFFDELHGLKSGCSAGNGGSMHLNDKKVGFIGSTAIVANTIPVGVGLAQSLKIDGSNNFVYIFLGDGATEEGVFYESLHYAKLYSLPCLFIIENNEFSVYTPIQLRHSNELKDKVNGFGIQYVFNDNHNYRSLYGDFLKAIEYLRNGNGPFVFEVMTHRHREHCGPNYDDELGYREKEFLDKWESMDILDIFMKDMLLEGIKQVKISNSQNKIIERVTKAFEDSQNLANQIIPDPT